MRIVFLSIALVLLFGVQGLFAMAPVSGGDSTDGLALVQAKCGQCHKLDKVCAKLGNAESYWAKVVPGMISRGMADPGPEAQKAMVSALAGLSSGDTAICGQ